MTTLLEQAKQIKIHKTKKFDPEIADLAIAWFNDEVSTTQAKSVMSLPIKGNAQVRYYFASVLKHAILSGLVKIEKINYDR